MGSDLSYLPGDLGDARFINYILEHGYQFIIGNRDSFYDAPFFYPAKNVVAFSDNMIGNLPIYSFFRMINFSRETSLQLWSLSLFGLNFFVSFFCFYRYSKNFYASVIISYLFTFSIVNLVQYGYLQINAKFLLPPIFFYYFRWLATSIPKNLNVFLVLFFSQIIVGIYYAIFTIVFIIVIAVIHVTISKSLNPFRDVVVNFKKYGLSICIFLMVILASIIYLQPYFKVAKEVGTRTYNEVLDKMLTPASLISAHPSTLWSDAIGFGNKYFPENFWIHEYFPGIFPFLVLGSLLILILIRPKIILDYNLKLVLITFILMFFISIRWLGDFSPLKLFYHFGLFGAISFVNRIALVLDVVLLFIILNVLSKLFSFKNKYMTLCMFLLLFAFVFSDNVINKTQFVGRVKKSEVLLRYEKLEKLLNSNSLKNKKAIAIVEEVPAKLDLVIILDAMLFSQKLNVASINGYSSCGPANSDFFWRCPNRKELYNWCRAYKMDSTSVLIIDSPN